MAPTLTSYTVQATGVEGVAVTLSATATDPAGANDPLIYIWTVSRSGAAPTDHKKRWSDLLISPRKFYPFDENGMIRERYLQNGLRWGKRGGCRSFNCRFFLPG